MEKQPSAILPRKVECRRETEMNLASVLVCGDINMDLIARLAAPLAAGVDSVIPAFERHVGGVGANVAIALARGGVQARLLACAGMDAFADSVLEALRSAGVDVEYVARSSGAVTGLFVIPVNPDGQRTFIGSRGANQLLSLGGDWRCFDGVGWLHAVGQTFLGPVEAASAHALLAQARQRGVPISFDVGNAPARQLGKALLEVAADVDVLFVSYDEGAAITGKREHGEVRAALEQLKACEVVLKLGERGCMIRDAGAWREAPPIAVRAVDSTGAGDAFAAAYIRGRLRGLSKAACALLANAAGAAAASVVGAGECMPGPDAALDLLRATNLPVKWHAARSEAMAGG